MIWPFFIDEKWKKHLFNNFFEIFGYNIFSISKVCITNILALIC